MRLLRVLKLLRSLPQLQILVNALFDGLSSIFYIFLLMLMIIYLFANVGVIVFRENDPWHFGSLHRAVITLFRMFLVALALFGITLLQMVLKRCMRCAGLTRTP